MLKVYFDYDEWSAVEDLHKVKVRSFNCKKCTSICTESFIESSFCNTRIHLTVIQLVFTVLQNRYIVAII